MYKEDDKDLGIAIAIGAVAFVILCHLLGKSF